jgi:hypothetical protein
MRNSLLLILMSSALLCAQTSPLSPEQRATFHLPMHPESYFAGKVERIKAGETPHPLYDPQAYAAFIAQTEADFQKRVQQEQTKNSAANK